MNKEELLHEELILNLLRYLENKSKETIKNVSILVNRKRAEIFPENKSYKIGDQSKKIPIDEFNMIVENEKDEKIALCYKIMYYMGLRISEVVEIKINDIIGNQITIRNIKARRRETRTIPIILRNEIENYIQTHKENIIKTNNHIFYNNKKTNKISKDFIRNRFRANTLELGINKIYGYSTHKGHRRRLFLYSTHSLRHSFANRFYEKSGKDIEKTRIAMRHSLLKDTQTYIKGDLNEVSKIMEML